MTRFIVGMAVGLVIGLGASAYAATCIGSGGLHGWTVIVQGEEACTDPSVDPTSKEIECE